MHWNSRGNQSDNDNPGKNSRSRTAPGNVQILSPEERENFDGITIEQEDVNQRSAKTGSPFQKVFVLQSSSGGALSKLIVSALLLIAVVVFLPLAILFFATLGLNWLSNRSKE